MASPITLDKPIGALTGSVIAAQDKIGQHQISKISRYFNPKRNRPTMVTIKLPDNSPEAERYEDGDVHIPLLSLVGNNFLYQGDGSRL